MPLRPAFAALLTLLALLVPPVPALAADTATDTRTASESDVVVERTTHRLTSGGRTRSFTLVRPRTDTPTALVVALHGRRSSYAGERERLALEEWSASGWAAVVWPQGVEGSWNAGGGCCDRAARAGVDDVAFVDAVLARVRAVHRYDPRRVYAIGFSVGGFLAHRLACDRSRVFAGVASVAGTLFGNCGTGVPVSVLEIHGDQDSVVPYYGSRRSPTLGVATRDVPSTITAFLRRDGCRLAEQRRTLGSAVVREWRACRWRSSVTLVVFRGLHHQWPYARGEARPQTLAESFFRRTIRST